MASASRRTRSPPGPARRSEAVGGNASWERYCTGRSPLEEPGGDDRPLVEEGEGQGERQRRDRVHGRGHDRRDHDEQEPGEPATPAQGAARDDAGEDQPQQEEGVL